MSTFVHREGRSIVADEAFFAWTSGDLKRMVAALNVPTNAIDRHFLLQSIVALAYKARKDLEARELCRTIGLLHYHEFSNIAPRLMADMGGVMPRVTSFPTWPQS